MNLLRSFILVGLAGLSSIACGSDDAGGSVNPADCPAVGAKAKSLSAAAGCNDTSADVSSTCQQLYAAKLCTNEWARLINCISSKPNSDFQCDADHEFEPKAGVCTAEQTAFSSCLGT
ncbi:MAG: hypothetical protein ABIQ16_25170 [Polyangiaceae bacterium]